MKKRIALVAVLFVLVALLVSCGNTKELSGTEWNNYLGLKTGWRLSFDTSFVDINAVALGIEAPTATETLSYTYADPNVTFYYDSDVVGTAVIDGNKMTADFEGSEYDGTYKKK
jgi:hypothetical protein